MAHTVAKLAAQRDRYAHQAVKSAGVGAPEVTHTALRGSVG